MNAVPNIPKLSSVRTAVTIFYVNNELGNAEIRQLFNCSAGKAQQLKNYAIAYTRENGQMPRCNLMLVPIRLLKRGVWILINLKQS